MNDTRHEGKEGRRACTGAWGVGEVPGNVDEERNETYVLLFVIL